MKTLLSYALLLGLTSFGNAEQAQPEKAETPTKPIEVTELTQAEFEVKVANLLKTNALTKEKVLELYSLAKKYPKAKGAAYVSFQNYHYEHNPKKKQEKLTYFMSQYIDSDQINYILYSLIQSYSNEVPKLMHLVMLGSNKKENRHAAAFALASWKHRMMRMIVTHPDVVKFQTAELISMYNSIIDTPGMNERILKKSKAALYMLETFSIGCEAPEIIGTDHEDKEFKLSDYRGKVVLVDFWADW